MKKGFTLIELLVVVTIIVVLLAMLLPAMNRAIYQAILVSCAANQKVVSSAAIGYAFGAKRYYPPRGNLGGAGGVRAYLAPMSLTNTRASYDYRPTARAMGLNVNNNFQCPLVERIDLEDSLPNEWVAGNQAFWFGWHYISGEDPNLQGMAGTNKHKGMFRLGDTFEWGGRKYHVMIGDWDKSRPWDPNGPNAQAAHPDVRSGIMYNWAAVRVPLNDALLTLSYWQSPQPPASATIRGTLDNNFGYDDGSVRRVNEIELNDDRMARVPSTQSNDPGGDPGLQVPRE